MYQRIAMDTVCAKCYRNGNGTVFVVVTLVTACTLAWQSGWVRIAWRAAGGWIAATGLLLLGWSPR